MLPKQTAIINGYRLVLEVARTPAERAHGLMKRQSVPDGTGMLFVFDKPGYHSFWMKDTYVPLMVYWISYGGRITDRAVLRPYDLTSVVPSDYASHAVEVPLHWALTHNVRIGDRFQFV